MKKEKRDLGDFFTEELLFELLMRKSMRVDGQIMFGEEKEGPNKVTFYEKHYCINVGIGKDNTASIYLTQDDVDALNAMLADGE